MKNELDDLKNLWNQTKERQPATTVNLHELITLAKSRKKAMLAEHYGNTAVLSATVVMLMFYFYYLYPFAEMLSKVGVNVMIGGLLLRIIIELFSVARSRKIDVTDTTANSLQTVINFYGFRKRVHGPVTTSIVLLYFIGIYLLTPEIGNYVSWKWLALLHAFVLVFAFALYKLIRRGIRKEMTALEKLIELQTSLTQES